MISGFSYVHNAFKVGIPIREAISAVRPYVDEVVIVDAQSTDGTREWLLSCDEVDRVIDAAWGSDGGATLKRLHAMNNMCEGDTIIHFEADEVYDDEALKEIVLLIKNEGISDIMIQRLQVEQNFQRIRWYPEYVQRVFSKGSVTKNGHTTEQNRGYRITPHSGYLWDVTNCFRDNWIDRVEQQAALWGHEPSYRMVPLHANGPFEITRERAEEMLKETHWTRGVSPLDIPQILRPLIGKTKYD